MLLYIALIVFPLFEGNAFSFNSYLPSPPHISSTEEQSKSDNDTPGFP